MKTESNKLYTNHQIRELEAKACKLDRCSSYQLMERAGRSAFDAILKKWPTSKVITIFCGGGNNGGDGYVVARIAHEAGLNVDVLYLVDPKKLKGAALIAYQSCLMAGVAIQPVSIDNSIDKNINFSKSEILVDALLGTGLAGEVREDYQTVINQINQSEKAVVAIDIPSGLNADTGYRHGCAVNAAMTVTFIGLKVGLYTGSGPACCGEIICDDLEISKKTFELMDADQNEQKMALINFNQLKKENLKPRAKDAHKGDFGHVLVVGGDYGMVGAARMAGEAAARVGAGLTSVATRKKHLLSVTAMRPELMAHAIKEPSQLGPLLKKATAIALGPGLGQTDWSWDLFNFILAGKEKISCPIIVDADALNLLSQVSRVSQSSQKDHKKYYRTNWILTPHPGEAARLLQVSTDEIARDRVSAARDIAKRYGGICVLKGAGTLVCDQNGNIYICTAGNPGMSTGGMGDVLTGVIAGLVAQGIELDCAASLGVALHGMAGDRAAKISGERGLLALDLMPQIQALVN